MMAGVAALGIGEARAQLGDTSGALKAFSQVTSSAANHAAAPITTTTPHTPLSLHSQQVATLCGSANKSLSCLAAVASRWWQTAHPLWTSPDRAAAGPTGRLDAGNADLQAVVNATVQLLAAHAKQAWSEGGCDSYVLAALLGGPQGLWRATHLLRLGQLRWACVTDISARRDKALAFKYVCHPPCSPTLVTAHSSAPLSLRSLWLSAARLEPGNPNVWAWLGHHYNHVEGDAARGRRCYERALAASRLPPPTASLQGDTVHSQAVHAYRYRPSTHRCWLWRSRRAARQWAADRGQVTV